jgi:uncharacterized protein YggE
VRRALVIVLVLLVIAALAAGAVLVFRGDSDAAKAEPIRIASPTGSFSSYVSGTGATSEPVARLPGITVIGTGEVEVKPDLALIRLTVGAGSQAVRTFPGTGETVALIDEDKLDPIVDELVDAGAPRDEIYIDPFGGSSFGPDNPAAVITLEWPKPQNVREILTTAQRAIRKTEFGLEDVAVIFMREDCDDPDQQTANAALADARKRAERIASLSHAKLGQMTAVSEASSGGYLSLFTQQQCGADAPLGALEYQAAAATADKMKVSTTLEVTFALDR